MDAKTRAFLDQLEKQIVTSIRGNRWAIQYVGGSSCAAPDCACADEDGPSFAYTVGLHGLGHPELLIFGVSPGTASRVLNELGDRIRRGADLVAGQPIDLEHWKYRIVPEPLPNPEEILFTANDFYRRPTGAPVPALQLSYEDDDGRFPWQDGSADADRQPRPGSFRA